MGCKKIVLAVLIICCISQSCARGLYKPLVSPPINLNDNKLHIFLCGTGVPQVEMQSSRQPACVAMLVNQKLIMFDAGEGSLQTIASIGLPYTQLETIFLTHLHSDHMAGLGSALNSSWYSGRSTPVTVYGPYGLKNIMEGIEKTYSVDVVFRSIGGAGKLDPNLALGNAIELTNMTKAQEIYRQNGLTISAFPVNHLPVFPAYGYQINYQGCKIVISGDTKVTPSLGEQAKNADILISEAMSVPLYQQTFTPSVKSNPLLLAHAQQIFSYHANSLELAKMAADANVKQLVLTHLLPAIPTTADAKKSFIAGMDQHYKKPIIVGDDKDELIVEGVGGTCKVTYVPASSRTIKLVKYAEKP